MAPVIAVVDQGHRQLAQLSGEDAAVRQGSYDWQIHGLRSGDSRSRG